MFQRIISCSLSPNTDRGDVWLALRLLLSPQSWRTSTYLDRLDDYFHERYPGYSGCSFNAGRSALYVVLKSFGIGDGDEVIVQAFTCVAVPNSVLWTGAAPVYADIDESLNPDASSVESRITRRTKAVIVQHSFGQPAHLDRIVALCHKRKLLLIEDCAHAIGATYKGKPAGSFGDAVIFSFGRDKMISSVFGGYGMIADKHKTAVERLNTLHQEAPAPGDSWVAQQLLHPLIFAVALPLYRSSVGKLIIYLAKMLGLLSSVLYDTERRGGRPDLFPSQFSEPLARLVLYQLKKLPDMLKQRRAIAEYYQSYLPTVMKRQQTTEESSFLRFVVQADKVGETEVKAKAQGILLGSWYRHVIDPDGTDLAAVEYKRGSCPKAEAWARHAINLPAQIRQHEAERVVRALS